MSTVAHPSAERRSAAAQAAAALRTEAGLARLALGVIGLHVVDDNFLQPVGGEILIGAAAESDANSRHGSRRGPCSSSTASTVRAAPRQPAEYERRVLAFFDRALVGKWARW
jgi:hypothetical protein